MSEPQLNQPLVPQQVQRIPGPFPPVYHVPIYPAVLTKPKRRWGRIAVAACLALAVVGLLTWQAIRIVQLTHRLSTVEGRAVTDRDAANAAAQAVASRVATLEKAAFRPEQIAAAVLPSVFRVKAGDFSGTAWAVGMPTGSGGTFLFTNFHVVQAVWDAGVRRVGIEHGDVRFDATIVRTDKDRDLAQLETTAKFEGLVVAKDPPHAGEPVVVVGAPFGMESSVTSGVVSSISRKIPGEKNPFLQFDAPINPGNSGGPVINARGEVVGIASAKVPDAEGIGFAIPIELACEQFPICTN